MAFRKRENPVPKDILQAKAEEVWKLSKGEWGTPPRKPLESYDEMCKRKGLKGRTRKPRRRGDLERP